VRASRPRRLDTTISADSSLLVDRIYYLSKFRIIVHYIYNIMLGVGIGLNSVRVWIHVESLNEYSNENRLILYIIP